MRLHNLKLAKINAIKALTGQELYREEPDLPPLPYLPIFIPKEKMKEMVREALKNPAEWKIILSGKTKVDLPVLNKLKQS